MYLQTVIYEEFISQLPFYAYIITYSMLRNKYLYNLRDIIALFISKNNKNIFILFNQL